MGSRRLLTCSGMNSETSTAREQKEGNEHNNTLESI